MSLTADSLPIWKIEDEIIGKIRDHRVIVVEGPTGSGKTTQLPRMLLRSGLANGVVGVTQPRRIAAVSVAWRTAEEAGVSLGEEVGYAIRFDDRTGPDTLVKVMTDGILLMEARTDPTFSAYGVIIVDEAHERTLNIDFTLGLLKRALTLRDDLTIIISSATLEPETFQRFFGDVAGEVPLVSIAARAFPVDIRYSPLVDDTYDGISDAITEHVLRIHKRAEPGHILVFLPGEGLIHRTADTLAAAPRSSGIQLLELFGRLKREEQEEVFKEFSGKRKVILATNIAETSITIPDVRYVIDSGLAKVPRFSSQTGITTLGEEGISRASADQRAGRAGRTAPGKVIRLYDRADYGSRPAFTEEEILRLDLSDVCLRLISLGVGDVRDFPFPTPPPGTKIRAALQTLRELDAIDSQQNLTPIGERMVPFPLTPRLARMVVEAADHFPDVVEEVLMVAAFRSARTPFQYPDGEEHLANRAHDAMQNSLGDAMTAVDTLRAYRRSRTPERYCRQHFLDHATMAFMDKAFGQLTEIAEKNAFVIRSGGDPQHVNRCVLAAFAQNLLVARKGREYEGPSQRAIFIHPSSGLSGARHRFVVAAQLMVSRRTYASFCSVVKPAWVADVNPELAQRLKISSRRKRHVDPKALPETIRVGEVELHVAVKRGAVYVEIPLEVVPQLRDADATQLPTPYRSWKARLVSEKWRWTSSKLGPLLESLAFMPLPDPDDDLTCRIPEGALLEADRNIHGVTRYLDQVLAPMLPRRGRRPGWVMLVSNGGGGFWYEVTLEFADAVKVSDLAVEDLRAQDVVDDALDARLAALDDRLDELLVRLGNAGL